MALRLVDTHTGRITGGIELEKAIREYSKTRPEVLAAIKKNRASVTYFTQGRLDEELSILEKLVESGVNHIAGREFNFDHVSWSVEEV